MRLCLADLIEEMKHWFDRPEISDPPDDVATSDRGFCVSANDIASWPEIDTLFAVIFEYLMRRHLGFTTGLDEKNELYFIMSLTAEEVRLKKLEDRICVYLV